MKQGWANNGQPLEDGRLCYVIDLEDGSRPIKTYGKSVEDVLEKVARTAAHAEVAYTTAKPTAPGPVLRTPAPPTRKTMTADEQMIATADLSNPAKAPQAVARLLDEATGLSVEEMQRQRFRQEAEQWRLDHPEITEEIGRSPLGELLVIRAINKAGGIKFAGYDHLESAYREMQAEGKFLETGYSSESTNLPAPAAPRPRETPAPSGARPRGGSTFATSYRSTRIGSGDGTRGPQQRLKYTREQIDNMPLEQMRRLIESGDRDYAAAVEFYSQPR